MEIPQSAYPKHPRLAVGAVVFKDNKILLVQRGRPPAEGQWAIPGGNVKLGESLQAAAEREIMEETGIVIRAADPIYTFDAIVKDGDGKIRFHYVIVDLAADYVQGDPKPGDDAVAVRWVSQDELKDLNVSPPTSAFLKERFDFGR